MAKERINIAGQPITRSAITHFEIEGASVQLDGELKITSLIVYVLVDGQVREASGSLPGVPVQQLRAEIRRVATAEVEKLRVT